MQGEVVEYSETGGVVLFFSIPQSRLPPCQLPLHKGAFVLRLPLFFLQIPSIQRVSLDRAKQFRLQIGVLPLQLRQQHLHLLAAAGAVGGAGIVDNGQVQSGRRTADLLLVAVQQGPDLQHVHAVQMGHRLEAADAPLKEEVHQQRFHIVLTQLRALVGRYSPLDDYAFYSILAELDNMLTVAVETPADWLELQK